MKRFVDWWFADRRTGRLVFAQWPNIPLWIWIAGSLLRMLSGDNRAGDFAGVVATLALVVWALLEIWKGINPFRRLIGGVVLAGIVLRLL